MQRPVVISWREEQRAAGVAHEAFAGMRTSRRDFSAVEGGLCHSILDANESVEEVCPYGRPGRIIGAGAVRLWLQSWRSVA